jgi:hypothetical protein
MAVFMGAGSTVATDIQPGAKTRAAHTGALVGKPEPRPGHHDLLAMATAGQLTCMV